MKICITKKGLFFFWLFNVIDLDVIGVEGGVVSSQALIMQDRPPGLPAKLHQERDRHSQAGRPDS